MVLAVEEATTTAGLSVNLYWVVVALANFAIAIAFIAGIVLLVRWLLVSRPRKAREEAELRERVARLEAAQSANSARGESQDGGLEGTTPRSATSG